VNIALFPLNTVLFPQGLLPLRVFEVRYTDMVRDCLRTNSPFGVVNIVRGSDTKSHQNPEHCITGTLATIVDFDMHEPAVLLIAAQGGQRFRVDSTNAQATGLLRANVTLIPNDDACTIATEQQKSAALLAQIIKELEQQHDQAIKDGQKPLTLPVAKPYHLDDAGWVANRFAELMPIARHNKQMLLETHDPTQRLAWINDFLKEKEVL
jgi:Lon protease-like protein